MQRSSAFAFLVTISIFAFTAWTLPTTNPEEATEKALIQMENEWGAAVSNKDPTALDRIIADDWVGRYPYAIFSKGEELEVIRSRDLRVESVASSDLKVRLFDGTAIVTGTDDDRASYKGMDISGRYLWMDVFVERNGQWRVVASQETLVMK